MAALKALRSEIEDSFLSSYENYANLRIPDCVSSNCPDIDQTNVHSKEERATNVIYSANNWFKSFFVPPEWIDVQEFLRFRSDDPRDKFLFISAEHDDTGALEPWLVSKILGNLAIKYDLKFLVTNKHQDICKAIEDSNKTGKLAHVFILAHGSYHSIVFDAKKMTINEKEIPVLVDGITKRTDFAKCFSGLQSNGKIILLSCSTGKEEKKGFPFLNIAQKIADGAKRTVIAPTDLAYPIATSLQYEDDPTLFHSVYSPLDPISYYLFGNSANLFTSFRPNFQKCSPQINENSLTEREKKARSVIKTTLISKAFLHKDVSDQFTNQFLQVCKDDPRDALIYFSAQHEKNLFLDPDSNSEFLSVLADRFNFWFKEIRSNEDICDTIEYVKQRGRKIAGVVIQAHGSPEKGMILSKDESGNEELVNGSNDLNKCLARIPEGSTIVLIGGSTAQNKAFVQKMANVAKRTVLASTCPVIGNDIIVQSTDPLELQIPGYSPLGNFFLYRCEENGDNHFRTFKPNNPKIREEL